MLNIMFKPFYQGLFLIPRVDDGFSKLHDAYAVAANALLIVGGVIVAPLVDRVVHPAQTIRDYREPKKIA